MIERFNFYDVYGYLIPGVVLILTLLVPEYISSPYSSDTNEWVILIAGVAVAYLAGNVLQTIAMNAIPSSKDAERKPRSYYSVTILNKDDATFSKDFKEHISSRARDLFQVDLHVDETATDAIASARQDAFQLARRLPTKTGYADQFQGLEVMMRGVTLALWCGSAYSVGFAIGPYLEPSGSALIALSAAIVICFLVFSVPQVALPSQKNPALPDAKDRHLLCSIAMWLLIADLAVNGALVGSRYYSNGELPVLLLLATSYLGISFRLLSAYYVFAKEFAKAVWVQLGAFQR
jgi:hypothetical protein